MCASDYLHQSLITGHQGTIASSPQNQPQCLSKNTLNIRPAYPRPLAAASCRGLLPRPLAAASRRGLSPRPLAAVLGEKSSTCPFARQRFSPPCAVDLLASAWSRCPTYS